MDDRSTMEAFETCYIGGEKSEEILKKRVKRLEEAHACFAFF
jgi:hypothetical protein